MIRTRTFVCAVLVAVCFCFTNIQAEMLDLTFDGANDFINGAFFQEIDESSTGSGVIQSFVRIQKKGIERGYNTDGALEFDENTSSTFTHSLLLSDVPIVKLNNILYREFLLDINQTKNINPSLLSLDTIEIYEGTVSDIGDTGGNLTGYATGGLGNKIYDLDTGGDNWILLNYALNAGSGSGDMFAYIPNALFGSETAGDYLYLYSEFGGSGDPLHVTNAGFEEWAVRMPTITDPQTSVVPVPAAVLLGILGLGVMGLKLRRYA